MSVKNRKSFTFEEIESAINSSETMGAAAKHLNVDWRTFRYNAESFGLYKPMKSFFKPKYELNDILNGKHPQYPASKLKVRLVKEGLKEDKCEKCEATHWFGVRLSLELNHIDGNNSNNSLDNLEILCPNCHSITPTYRNKKRLEGSAEAANGT